MKNKFHFEATADLSKAFLCLSKFFLLRLDPKILWDAKKIRDPRKKAQYYSNLIAEMDNHILRLAEKFTTLLALILPVKNSLFKEEFRQELMNIVKIRLGNLSLNQRISRIHVLQTFVTQKISSFISDQRKQKRLAKDRFYPHPLLNLRAILSGFDLMESEAKNKNFEFKEKVWGFTQLHLIQLAAFRPKLSGDLLPIFLECLRIHPWLMEAKPKVVRGICEIFYYEEFSKGNEPSATQIAKIADLCLENIKTKENILGLGLNGEVCHADFTKTIGYLANLLILIRIQKGVEKIILLRGETHRPGNAFLMGKALESDRIGILSPAKSRRALKELRPWPIVHHVQLDGQKYNWYEGLWKACQRRKFAPLEWKEKDLQIAERHLAELGQTGLNRFITLHIRDANYYRGENHENKYHGDRNASVSNYESMARHLLKAGYSIVLIGDNKANFLSFKDPKIFDYAHASRKAPILDIYFMSRCALFVGTNSGPFAVPGLYGIPALITNFTPIGNTLGFHNYFYLPKKIWSKKRRAFLSFREQLEAPQAYAQQISTVSKDYAYRENTAGELSGAGHWITEFLSGHYRPSPAYLDYLKDPAIRNFPRQISIPEFYFQMNQGYFRG